MIVSRIISECNKHPRCTVHRFKLRRVHHVHATILAELDMCGWFTNQYLAINCENPEATGLLQMSILCGAQS